MGRIHIWSDARYGSKDFLSIIPTPTHGLKVKVTDLEVYSWSLLMLKFESFWSAVSYFPE